MYAGSLYVGTTVAPYSLFVKHSFEEDFKLQVRSINVATAVSCYVSSSVVLRLPTNDAHLITPAQDLILVRARPIHLT